MAYRGSNRLLLLLTLVLAGCGNPPAPAVINDALPPAPTAVVASAPAATSTPSAPASSTMIDLSCPDARGPIDAPIVFGSGNSLNMIRPDGGGLSLVLELPETSWAHEPAWSPDGTTLAYMLSLPGTGNDIPGLQISLICGLDRATGKGRVLLQGNTSTEALEEPAWMPDGHAMLVTRRTTAADPQTGYISGKVAIVRYQLASGAAQVLVEGATSPAISPDGRQLAYVRYDEQTTDVVLVLAKADGMEGGLIAETQPPFGVFTAPRWSPDGTHLLFSASRGPVPPAPAPAGGRSLLDILLGVQVAQAHGEPACLWMVDKDGQNMQQMSLPNLDDPRSAWSPDGSLIALASGSRGGVAIIDPAKQQRQQLTEQGDFGGISWAPAAPAVP